MFRKLGVRVVVTSAYRSRGKAGDEGISNATDHHETPAHFTLLAIVAVHMFATIRSMSFPTFLFMFILFSFVCARPEPASPFLRQPDHPNHVGFVLPQQQSPPPYAKSLSPTSSDYTRSWHWTQWLTDAKANLNTLLRASNRRPRPVQSPHYEDRHIAKFENEFVLRVNVSSLTDRIAITELAEVICRCWSANFRV
jgi:hypothetical protein